MLSPSLFICFASSLLVTASVVPAKRILTVSTPNIINPPAFSLPSLPTVLLTNNLTTTARRRPSCWPDDPDADPGGKIKPIKDRLDCLQVVKDMLSEGPDGEPLVWDRTRVWVYESCGLFLVPSTELPIHRGTFSRNDIADCAESIRLACVTEKYGYRGGILPVDAGVFRVAIAGEPVQPSLGEMGAWHRLQYETSRDTKFNPSGGPMREI